MISRTSTLISPVGLLPKWLDYPEHVLARSPYDPDTIVRFRIDTEFALTFARANRKTPALELWCQVIGRPPPVPNVARQAIGEATAGLIGLRNAHACFSGIRRPIGADSDGSSVLSYVTRPMYSFKYEPDLVTQAKKYEYPPGLVYVINVKLDNPYPGGAAIPEGIVTHWGSVESDKSDDMLPMDFRERFTRRLW
jgi:hypothetical protein